MTKRGPGPTTTGRGGLLLVFFGLWLLVTAGVTVSPVLSAWVVHHQSASWQPVPCTLDAVKLVERSHGRRGASWAVDASYHYEVNGKRFDSRSVDHLPSYSDRRGTIQRHRFRPLEDAMESGQPHLGWVDPDDPTRSVLFRDLPPFAYVMPLFSALLGVVGLRVFVAGVLARRRWYRRARLGAEHPGRTWRVDELWDGFATRSSPEHLLGAWLATAYFVAMAAIFVNLTIERHARPAGKVLTVAMAVVATLLVVRTVYVTLRHLKFGRLRLATTRMPVRPGERLEGIITCGRRVEARDGFALTLRCHERHGRSRKVRFEADATVTQDLLGALSDEGTMIPVAFQVPGDQPATDLMAPQPVWWTLEVRSATAGVDLAASFPVAVYACPDDLVEVRG